MFEINNVFSKIQSERGKVASIHTAFQAFPKGVEAHFNFYKSIILDDDVPLRRSEREFLALETSKINKCAYCIGHHEEAYERYSSDEISEIRQQLFRELASTLSLRPWMSSSLENKFIENGFLASEWQHAVMVVSYFNLANRCAYATGIELEKDFVQTCN